MLVTVGLIAFIFCTMLALIYVDTVDVREAKIDYFVSRYSFEYLYSEIERELKSQGSKIINNLENSELNYISIEYKNFINYEIDKKLKGLKTHRKAAILYMRICCNMLSYSKKNMSYVYNFIF